jgi:DNA mismatch repair ATPase MutS
LEARQNHYLAAVDRGQHGGPLGIAALDLSTGELLACEAPDAASALSELVRLDPREVLVSAEA